MITNNNIYYNMEEFDKLIVDPRFIAFLDGIIFPGYRVTYDGSIRFTIILN